jgi:hypothetical protein
MNPYQLESLRVRIAALKAELRDTVCKQYPVARAHVQAELEKAEARLKSGRKPKAPKKRKAKKRASVASVLRGMR